ncbi:MAG TPA: secretin N-terminal domain-containing protein [Candidatus Elarobacter sp.]|jgi:type II secretory pathway component GspD/PulD (secretin)
MALRGLFALICIAAISAAITTPLHIATGEPSATTAPHQSRHRGPHTVWSKTLSRANVKDVAELLRTAFGPDFYAVGDPRTHTLVINGSPQDVSSARSMIAKLDAAASAEPAPARTDTYYELKYAVPNPVASGTIASHSGTDLVNTLQSVMIAPSASPPPDIRFALDPSYPRILISGTTKLVTRAMDMLAMLDLQPALIQLEARVYEFDEQVARNNGFSIPTNSIQTTISEFNPAAAAGGTATPMPVLALAKIVRAPFSIATQLNFLIANGYASLVSEPRVATINGRLAILDISDKIPFVANSVTSNGVLAPVVYDYSTGTHLEVVPSINTDGTITAYLHPVYSTLTSITNQGAPEISKRETSTTLTLRPGESVVISGLESQSYSQLVNRPFKYIPIINVLTKSKTVQATRAHVFIVLTPTIVDYGGLRATPASLVPKALDAPPTGLPVYKPYGHLIPGQPGPDDCSPSTPSPGSTPIPCPTAAPDMPNPRGPGAPTAPPGTVRQGTPSPGSIMPVPPRRSGTPGPR